MNRDNRLATLLSVTCAEVYANGRIKYYPNAEGVWEIGSVARFEERGAFRKKGFEICGAPRMAKPSRVRPAAREHIVHDESLDEVTYNPQTGEYVRKWGYRTEPTLWAKQAEDKGRRRAITRVFDYLRCNWQLDCMFTLTLDAAKIDRTEYATIVKKIGEWFANRVRRNGLCYLAVPEYHADGEAIHFHGVCNFDALQTKYSHVVHGGKGVYNITDFPYGFTAVKKIGTGAEDRHAVAVYVSKYITKSTEKVGGRYYLHGGKLEKPREVVCEITDADVDLLTKTFSCSEWSCPTPQGGRYVKIEVQHFPPAETEVDSFPSGSKGGENVNCEANI